MTREILPAPGRIEVTTRVTSNTDGKIRTSTETGGASMHNVAREYRDKIEKAKQNAIFRHLIIQKIPNDYNTTTTTEVLDFNIIYFTKKTLGSYSYSPNLVKITKYKDAKSGKTYAYATDKVTGKRVNKARIVRKGKLEEDFEGI